MLLLDKTIIKKEELLIEVRANLAVHEADIVDLLEARREAITEWIEMIAEALVRKDKDYQPKSPTFPMPEDNTASYKKAIRMLEMTTEEKIELDQNQFEKLVLDEWQWKSALSVTKAFYGKG